MKIVVVGCGKIGTAIIGSLVAEGHDVTAVDINAEVISGITDQYDVMTVQGNGVDCDTLTEAGVADARLFISVTPCKAHGCASYCGEDRGSELLRQRAGLY